VTLGGAFVISLDLELHWGIHDHTPVDGYRDALLGVRKAVPLMLELFERREIAATWATVGFLFAETKAELERHFPSELPTYTDPRMSPYASMGSVGADEMHDPFHFGASLVRAIAKTPRQEIGTHTFSHYYCMEPGQTAAQFEADLDASKRIGAPFGDVCKSIVFPRNQVNPAYLDVLHRAGVRTYRPNPEHWAYRPTWDGERPARRAFRLADAYLPLSGAHTHAVSKARHHDRSLRAVPASAFLRPFDPRTRVLDGLRLRRIKGAMTRAARRGELFHLWWHPHNFGRRPRESMAFLSRVIDHFGELRRSHGMESLSMAGAAGVDLDDV
jgi:peptidoglycan/xylan/chitin deacetylase (PgdA/CDA1 family)